jgi:hypothetical protein
MTDENKEDALRQITFLRARGHVPHEYEPTTPYSGCLECGQGPGALQHNTYLVSDFHEIHRERAATSA